MAHFALLWKARTIEKYRLRYENEKLNSIMSSNTEMPRQTFSQKWKHYHLSTKRHISTQFQKWYPEGSAVSNFFLYLRTDKTFLNFILKSLIGFIGGILLTYLCFMFLVYQLSISLMHAVVVSSFIGVLLTLGLAFSYRVRCLVFLLIPQFFSRVGRYTLTCYALILILTGPATNTLKNSEVLSESMACGQEQIKITVKNLQYSIANPINAIKDNIKAMINGLREVAVTLKTVVVKINRLILSVARIFESSNTWLESIVRNCNTRFGTPFDRCVKTMNEALTDLRASANPFSVRTVYKNDSFLSISICRSVRRYASSCGAVDVVNVAAVVRKCLKSFSNRIKSMLFLDAHLQRSYSFSSNSSRSASQVAAGIVTEIRKKADPLLTWLSWSSCVTSLFLLLILFRAKYYQHMFETRSRFDNRYITKELRDLDLRRLREGKETVLPLNRRERSKYITTTSFRLLPSERVYLSRSIVFMTITTFKLMIHMVADYSLYWVLTTIRYHGRFQTTRQAPDSDAGIHISGSGLISDFFMAVIRALSDPLMHRVPSPVACLPDPHPPDFQRYTQIGILIFLLWFVALFEPYGLRLRHVVMGHYRPERANARALWLYNHILRTRGFFMKYARRKLRREFKHSSDRKLTFSYWIHNVIPYPWLQNLLGTGPEDPHCILCGTTHLENDPDTNLTVCQSFNCPGTYCTRCYSDIGQMCTICMSPVDYGDFSDMSLEKGSSEEDEDDDAHFSSSFWHSHTLISETDLDIDKPLLRKSSKTNLDLGGAKIRRPSSHGLNEEVEEIRCRRNYITKQAMIRHIRFCNNRHMNTKMPKNIQSINVGDCKVCAMYKKHNDKTNKNHVQTPKYPINHSRQTLRKYKSRKSKYRFSKTLHKNNSFKCSSRRRGLRRSRNSDKWRNIEILQWKPFGKGPWPTRKKDKKQWKVNIQDSKYSCRSRAFGDCNNKGKNNSTRTTKASKKGGAQQPYKEEDQIKKNKSLEDKFRKKNANNWRRSEGIKLMKTGKKPSVYGVFRNKFSNIWKYLTMKSHIDIQTNTDPKKKENHKRKKKLQTAWSNTEVMMSKRKQDEESRKHRISSFLDDQDWRKRGQIHERNFPECIEIGESAELTQSKVLKTEAEILKDIIFEKTQQLTLDPQIKLTIEPGATDVTSRVLQIVDYLEELLSINSEAKKKVSSKTEKDIKKSGSNFKYNLEINDPALPMEYLDLFYEPRNTSSQANIPLIPLDKLSRSLPRINVHRVHKSDGKHKRALSKLPQKSVNKIPTVRSSVIGVHSEKKKKSVVRKEHKTEHRRRHDKRNKAANDKGDNDKVTNSKETNNIEVNNEQSKNDTEYEKTNNKETHNKGTNANGDCEKTTTNKCTKDKDVKIPKDVNKVDNTNQVDFHYENPLFTYSSEKNESCASDNKEMATNTKWYLDMITAGATAPAKQIEKILEVENKEEVDKKVESKQVPKLVGKDIERAACKKGYSKQDKKLYCSKCMAYTSKGKCGCKITSNSRSSVIKCCYYSNNSSSFDKYLSLKMRQIMESLIKCSEIPEIPEKVDELNGTVECTSKCCQYESPPSFSKGIAGPSFNSILTSLDMGGQVPSLCLSSNRSLSGVTQASYCHEDVAICPKYAAQKFLENILKDPCVCVDTSTSFDSFPKYKSVEPNNKPVQTCKYKSTPSSSRAPQPRKTVKTNEKAAKGKPLPKQKIVKKYVKSQDKFTPDISEETSCDECKGCIDDSSTLSITVSVRESISHDDKVKKPIKKFESKKMKGFKKVFKKTKKTKCICFDEKTSTTELKAVTRDNSCKCPDLKELFGYDPNGPLEEYLRRGAHPNEPEKVTKYVQYEKSYGTEPKDKHTEDSRQYKTVGVGGNFMILVDRDVQTPDDMFPDLGSSPPIPREMTDSDQPKKSKCTCAIQCCGKKLSGSSVDDQKSNAGMYMSWCPNDKKPEKQLREIPLQRDRNVRSTTKLRITEPLQDRTYRSTTKLQVKDPPDEPDNRNTRQLQRQPIVNNAARSTVQMKMEDDDNHKKAETKAVPPANGISFEVKKAANKPAGNTSVNKGEREGKKQRRPRSYTIIGRVKHSHAAFKPNADDGRCEFCKRNNAVTSKQVSFNDEVVDITACAVCGKKKESLAMENVFSTNRYLKQRNKLLLRTDSHQNIYFVG